MATERVLNLDAQRSLVMVVDMQNNNCTPTGQRYSPRNAAIIPNIKGLLDKARAAHLPTIFMQSVRSFKEPQFTVFGYPDRILQEGSKDAEIVEALSPQKGDFVVKKHSHDAFYKTELDDLLAKLVDDPTTWHAIVTGVSADVCAYHAVMGFHLRDYWTVVPVDCIASVFDGGTDLALRQFSLKGYSYNIQTSRSDLITFRRAMAKTKVAPP